MLQQLVAHFSAVNAKTKKAIERTERDRDIAFPSLTTLRNYVLHIPRKIGCDKEPKIAARSGEYLSKFVRKTSAKELNKGRTSAQCNTLHRKDNSTCRCDRKLSA